MSGHVRLKDKPKALDHMKKKSAEAKDTTPHAPYKGKEQTEDALVPADASEWLPRQKMVHHILHSRAWNSAKPHTKTGALSRCDMIDHTSIYGPQKTLPEMRVIAATDLVKKGRIPRWSARTGGCPSVPVTEILEKHGSHGDDDRSEALIVYVSHRWLKPWEKGIHPRDTDADDVEGSKVHALCHFAEWVWTGNYVQSQKYIFEGHKIKEVYFWIDYCCVDQDNPAPFIPALPLYMGVCREILCYETDDFESRAWCRLERIMAYAFCEGGQHPWIIKKGFKNVGQEAQYETQDLSSPKTGKLTREGDRYFIDMLTRSAERSETYSCCNIFMNITCNTWVDQCLACWCGLYVVPWAVSTARTEKRGKVRLGKTRVKKRVLHYPPIVFDRTQAV